MSNKFDLRGFPRGENGLLEVEKGGSVATLRDQNGNVTLRPAPKFSADVRAGIWDVIAETSGGVTLGYVAKKLGLKKTPWLGEKIKSMVRDGYLFYVSVDYRPNMPAYLYYIKD